jgi:hypothetical protein
MSKLSNIFVICVVFATVNAACIHAAECHGKVCSFFLCVCVSTCQSVTTEANGDKKKHLSFVLTSSFSIFSLFFLSFFLYLSACACLCVSMCVPLFFCFLLSFFQPNPDAQPNMNPIYEGEPVFVKSIENGALYTIGQGEDIIPIVHMWGSAYQRGFAHGTLMKDKVSDFMNQTWTYFEDQVEQAINGSSTKLTIPPTILQWIANVGLDVALDLTYDATIAYTNPQFYTEMHGLADGAGTSFDTLRRIHMIGELTKGSCSMYGAWGTATPDGGLMQLRALDWDVGGPFKNFPQLSVYHTNGSSVEGYSWVNVGWSGWIASITGASANQMAICEIGVSFPDSTFGNESRIGIPFTNILRDILQFDRTIDDAKHRLSTAHRTCDLILGVGDGKSNEFTGVQYSYSVANFMNDTNQMPLESWHPRIKDTTWWAMDWLCPNYGSVMARQMEKFHGNITAENTIRYITPIVQTGDLHCAISDLVNMKMYVATAASVSETGPRMAYDRQFNMVDLNKLFATPRPSSSSPSPLPVPHDDSVPMLRTTAALPQKKV